MTTPTSTFDRTRSTGYLANHMARLFAQRLHERIRPLGLAPAQFMSLLELWENDGLTQRELVERLDVEQATMANTLSRMERDGLIERRAHESDARAKRIHLTDRARALRAPAEAAAREVNALALGQMSAEERDQFVGWIKRAIAGLQEGDEGEEPAGR
ncbi:MarR family winged helix-turn-helix transcriptional regulator [Pseudoroseicyclus tamaricis]|uniref:MarR family transcriptional regulator n=1 Tax=Pseudoroseicyclus tamaricis TaxID=2705421 RepID=A0A6B2K4H1_9RHOB|nr:MarR family transcriptional regulator [Pseudoroseicyclus tamaricis]NDV01586.1 MarR family transcriptional regulator [Pseudoroseicyclus tamaricis]